VTSSTKQLITIEKIRDNVDRVRIGTKEIILVGTAHVSRESERLVQEVIKQESPDAVAIELCESRYRSLHEPERWKSMQLSTVIREGKGYILISQLVLAAFQRKLGKQLDIRPGQEMLAAAQCAKERGHDLILADREIKITFKRLWRRLTWRTSFKLLHTALLALFDDQSISKEDVERIKSEAMLEDILAQFAQEFPDIKEVLINERDRYLGSQIISSSHKKIVAALGYRVSTITSF
jgi:pheromone shutdown-related protein TraB